MMTIPDHWAWLDAQREANELIVQLLNYGLSITEVEPMVYWRGRYRAIRVELKI